ARARARGAAVLLRPAVGGGLRAVLVFDGGLPLLGLRPHRDRRGRARGDQPQGRPEREPPHGRGHAHLRLTSREILPPGRPAADGTGAPHHGVQGAAPGGIAVASARGFTLIELMVVIVILGMLVALVAPNVFHVQERSNGEVTRAQMANLAAAVDMYALEHR